MHEAVFFDLDGTLADTAPDLAGALNRLLEEESRSTLPLARLRPHVSGGSRALLLEGFGLGPESVGYAQLKTRFLDFYAAHICDETTLFPGMEVLLNELERADIPWGIVTNKPACYTIEVVRRLGLDKRAVCVVSGDSAARPKPAADPILLAYELAGVSTSCLYVGDDLRDVQAGRAAGLTTVIAAWGYLGMGDPIEQWGGDHIVHHPEEILPLLMRGA